MEDLLECPFLHVDCTEMRCETDIMGPKAPYVGYASGSPLNNHLAATQGKRNIVFLDEFEVCSPLLFIYKVLPMLRPPRNASIGSFFGTSTGKYDVQIQGVLLAIPLGHLVHLDIFALL